jgi:predicted aldo/keto reductase-like oxidoreductase
MKYRLLGKSGLRVSEAALGTMTFGDERGWGSPKAEAQKIYETYREAGGNFIDTANFYTGGTSEKFVGEFIKSHRNSVVLATKYSNAEPGNDPNAAGNHRKSMMQAMKASLSDCRPTTSTYIGCTSGTESRPWKKSCAVWTISFARARFSTSASRTLPLGGSPGQIRWRSFEAGHSSLGCRSSTASSSGRSSANWFPWRKR